MSSSSTAFYDSKGCIYRSSSRGALGGLTSVAFGGSFWEGVEDGAFMGAISGLIAGGMGYGFTRGIEGVKLTLGQCISTEIGTDAGLQFISDMGDKFIKGENISFERVISNMLIAGGIGGVLGAAGYGMAKVLEPLKLKIKLKFENNGESGTDVIDTRNINGHRTSRYKQLSDDEISQLLDDIQALEADPSIFRFNEGNQTGF